VRRFLLAALARLGPEAEAAAAAAAAAPVAVAFPSLGDGYTNRTTRQVAAAFAALAGAHDHDHDHDRAKDDDEAAAPPGAARFLKRCVACVEALCRSGVSPHQLGRLPLGAQLPLRQALRACRLMPPPQWHARGYRTCGRDDLALLLGAHLPLAAGAATGGVGTNSKANWEAAEEGGDGSGDDDSDGSGDDDDDSMGLDDDDGASGSGARGRGPAAAWPSPGAAFTLVSPIAQRPDLLSPAPPPRRARRVRAAAAAAASPSRAARGGAWRRRPTPRVAASGGAGDAFDPMASFPSAPELSGAGTDADGPGSGSGSGSKWGGLSGGDADGLLALEAATEVRGARNGHHTHRATRREVCAFSPPFLKKKL
jgi:hypothetical protein